jgi:Xaa-Pro aminopeptidase
MGLKEFQFWLKKNKVDLALVLNSGSNKKDPNMFYFLQKEIDFGCIAIAKKSKPLMFAPGFEYFKLKGRKIKAARLVQSKKSGLFASIKKKFPRARKIGVNFAVFSVGELKALKKIFKKCKVVDIGKALLETRALKSKEEIIKLKTSAKISQQIVQSCIENIRNFKSESQISDFLKAKAQTYGHELSFEPIVACGANGASPHHEPANKKLKGFCVIDFGIKYKGYCSDITRTIYFGKPSLQEMHDYFLVLNAQKAAIEKIKIGRKCKLIMAAAEKALGNRKKFFIHGLGHGLGVEIHEQPNLKPKSNEKLQNNMIFTVEPGIYPKKYGIRIEDDVLLEKGNVVMLTKPVKSLLIIR